MECFCHKLSNLQFHAITDAETAILKTWVDWTRTTQSPSVSAPLDNQLGHAKRQRPSSASTSRPRKRRRKLSEPASAITDLIRTYTNNHAKTFFERESSVLDLQSSADTPPLVTIYITLERTESSIKAHQFIRRTCCYALASLHPTNTSIDPIVQEIENALPNGHNTVRAKVYRFLHIGTKWQAILQDFSSTFGIEPKQVTGLLCLIESASIWERAKVEDRRAAFTILGRTTDICDRALQSAPHVNKVINSILVERSFVTGTGKVVPLPSATAMSRPIRSNFDSQAVPGSRDSYNVSGARSPGDSSVSGGEPSDDADTLLLLLSFFSTSDKIPLELFRGATPQKRWSGLGEIQELDATALHPKLRDLLSDKPKLTSAFHELELFLMVSKGQDQTYTLNEDVARHAREKLSTDDHSVWKCQALIVAYRAIPWKYIESCILNPKLILPHLKHAVMALHNCYDELPVSTKSEIAFALIEASRFPNVAWKRFAIDQAEIASRGLDDPYLRRSIALSRTILSRISNNLEEAVSTIKGLAEDQAIPAVDARMHSAAGLVTIQCALNNIQAEDLSTAADLLQAWSPLSKNPSSLEQVVVFRKLMILGRVLRFQGSFGQSLSHYNEAQSMLGRLSGRSDGLNFEEDLLDLTCEHADTLRELNDAASAEKLLRAEITRRDQHSPHSGASRLELSLAEALFAQGHYQDAENLCLAVQPRPGLLKLDKVRLHITMAKIRHIKSDYESAFSSWNEAMKEMRKFQFTNGHATRIIILSICDTLRELGHIAVLQNSMKQAAVLHEAAKPGGVRYFIAGMQHWSEYLESRRRPSRF